MFTFRFTYRKCHVAMVLQNLVNECEKFWGSFFALMKKEQLLVVAVLQFRHFRRLCTFCMEVQY